MKKIIELLPWTEFLDVHFIKDPGIFISNFSKEYEMPAEIIFCDNFERGTKLTEFNGVKLVKLCNKNGLTNAPRLRHLVKFLDFMKIFTNYLMSQSGNFSHVILFHVSPYTYAFSKYIKIKFPSVKIYVKADSSGLNRIQNLILKRLIKYIDLISFESLVPVKYYQKKYWKNFSNKFAYIPNCFDDKSDYLSISPIRKENYIISVARFGTEQKNTELLLDVLASVQLKDFKVLLVGSVEEAFNVYLQKFFEKHSDLKEKIIFTGNISDRQKIYEFYRKSKIFILTSRWEGAPISFVEAAWFGNSIISTNVGAAKQFVQDMRTGFVSNYNPNDESIRNNVLASLSEALQKEIDKALSGTPLVEEKAIINIRKKYAISEIVKNDCFKKFFTNVE